MAAKQQQMIYFQETLDNLIYVGWSGAPSKRFRAHENDGKKLIALRPGTGHGTGTDEHAIHSFFSSDKVRPSTYGGKPIYDYIAWLISRGYVADKYEDGERLPLIPFDIWRPEKSGDPFLDSSGQCHLFDHQRSGPERISLASNLIHLSSETDEWYTPSYVIDLARMVFGGQIMTDPASCFQANRIIKAKYFYDRMIDGLDPICPWAGATWLNPPYGRGDMAAGAFVKRLGVELRNGSVTEAITCLNINSASALWFADVWNNASMHLIWRGRIDFVGPSEKESSPSKGSILSYFGPNNHKFVKVFASFGEILSRIGR